MSTGGLNLQNDIDGQVLGKFNGRNSGAFNPGYLLLSFIDCQNLIISFCSLQQQFIWTVGEDYSCSEDKGRGVGSPKFKVFDLFVKSLFSPSTKALTLVAATLAIGRLW